MSRPTVSLVLPVFNEEEVIPELYSRLQSFLQQLAMDAEVVFVDDGSKDRSLELLRGLAQRDDRVRVLSFARNFGHQTAISAGLDHARGKAVIVMDADLQDPPEVVREMIQKWIEGYDVVYGMRRTREGESAFKKFTAKAFYRLLARMVPIEVPLDTGDFRLMSRRVVVALRSLRESHRFVRGLVAWIGFRQTAVLYDRPGRFAGETKYPLRKMMRFALDGITSFSTVPLRLATYFGLTAVVVSLVIALWATVAHFGFHATVPGWTTTVVVTSLLSAVQLVMIGILGEYVGRIYEQVKQRPLYVVRDRINLGDRDDDLLDDSDTAPAATIVLAPVPVPAAPASESAEHVDPESAATVPAPSVPNAVFPPAIPAAPPAPPTSPDPAPAAAAAAAVPAFPAPAVRAGLSKATPTEPHTPALAAAVADPPPVSSQRASKGPPPLPKGAAGPSKPPPPAAKSPSGPPSKPPGGPPQSKAPPALGTKSASSPPSKPLAAPQPNPLSKKTLLGMSAPPPPDKAKAGAPASEQDPKPGDKADSDATLEIASKRGEKPTH